jgi:tetratricopeptide (TPR) repeat protein
MNGKVTGIVLALVLLCAGAGTGAAFAQTPQGPWWYTLEQGKHRFRGGDYGGALLSFEDARRQRRAMYEQMEKDYINFLSLPEVRRLGDSLDWAERYAKERRYTAAAAALEELYYRCPKENLNNSASRALTVLGTLKEYPEAEYWIGEAYRVEGELELALGQYRKALEQKSLFENPGFDLELLGKIAWIHKVRQEYNEMERTLLSILDGDTLWSPSQTEGGAGSFARQAMTRTLENEGISRFLVLYRYANSAVEEAHRLLGFYYYASGRHSRAQEHLMFSFLIQNTVIMEEIKRGRFDFSLGDLPAEKNALDVLGEYIRSSPLLGEFTARVDYYKTAYYLGSSLYGNGKSAVARNFWTFLSAQNQAGEWQTRARSQLRSPGVEPAIEMP